MNKKTMINLSVVLCSLLLGCGGSGSKKAEQPSPTPIITTCAGQSLESGTSCITLENREAIVYKPSNTIEGIAVFLHGAPGSPKKVSKIFNAKSISDSEQLISVSPQGINEKWGWESVNESANAKQADVDFIVNLLTKIRTDNNITTDKVYIFGYSAGGFMAYKLACQIPGHITAIVSLAGQYRGDFSACSTSTPVTVHHFHSPQDREVPIKGREVGEIKSVAETLAHWLLINGCSETFNTVKHPKVSSTSNGTETQTWEGCVKEVSFSALNNVPHEASYSAEVLKQIYQPIFN